MRWVSEQTVFEREIWQAAKIALRNSRLRKRDILEWSMSEIRPATGQVAVRLESVGCNICTLKHHDKRR